MQLCTLCLAQTHLLLKTSFTILETTYIPKTIIQLLILTIKHKKSEDNFGSCDSKNLTEAGVEESYNSLSKGWCKQKRSSKINLQGATVDDLNTCYEETVDDDGYINMVKPNKKCNKSPFGF